MNPESWKRLARLWFDNLSMVDNSQFTAARRRAANLVDKSAPAFGHGVCTSDLSDILTPAAKNPLTFVAHRPYHGIEAMLHHHERPRRTQGDPHVSEEEADDNPKENWRQSG
jgi:hypothetical protein